MGELKDVNLYIETSIRGPRRRPGAYAYVLEYKAAAGVATYTASKALESTTEHQSLGFAIRAAAGHLKRCNLTIHTSSSYIKSVFDTWLDNWIQNDFRNAKGAPVADAEVWKEIAEKLNGNPVQAVVTTEHTYRDWMLREVDSRAAQGSTK